MEKGDTESLFIRLPIGVQVGPSNAKVDAFQFCVEKAGDDQIGSCCLLLGDSGSLQSRERPLCKCHTIGLLLSNKISNNE